MKNIIWLRSTLVLIFTFIIFIGILYAGGYGPYSQSIYNVEDSVDIAVASTATIYTKTIKINEGEYFALSYKATSASGTPSVQIVIEQSSELPDYEGLASASWVTPENMSDIETNLTTEVWHHKAISPIALRYIRFKIVGSGSNPADTVVNMKLSILMDI